MRVSRIMGGLLCTAISLPVGTIAYALLREMFENTPIQGPALFLNSYVVPYWLTYSTWARIGSIRLCVG
jgi:hypothetical protein